MVVHNSFFYIVDALQSLKELAYIALDTSSNILALSLNELLASDVLVELDVTLGD